MFMAWLTQTLRYQGVTQSATLFGCQPKSKKTTCCRQPCRCEGIAEHHFESPHNQSKQEGLQSFHGLHRLYIPRSGTCHNSMNSWLLQESATQWIRCDTLR